MTQTSKTGFTTMTLCAPTREALLSAREHLRYWPYVKEFHFLTPTRMRVTVFIGRGFTTPEWHYYCQRSMELMSLCLRQYHAYMRGWSDELNRFCPRYHASAGMRPDDMLRPFCEFIDELDQPLQH